MAAISTSEPAASMAIPTVALAIAGASFNPSPTIATFSPPASFLMDATVSSSISSPHVFTSSAIGKARRHLGSLLVLAYSKGQLLHAMPRCGSDGTAGTDHKQVAMDDGGDEKSRLKAGDACEEH